MDIEEIDPPLSHRAYWRLARLHLVTVEHVCETSDAELLREPGLGQLTLREIRRRCGPGPSTIPLARLAHPVTRCHICGEPIAIGDYPCITTPRPHQRGINGAIGDACDVTQENGFATPQRFRSKHELTRALAEKGLEMHVRHMPLLGTDKSPYTSDWSRGSIDPVTLENGRILAERQAHTRATGSPPDPAVPVTWTIREIA